MHAKCNSNTKTFLITNAVLNLLCLFKSHIQTRSVNTFSYICSAIPLDLYTCTSLIVALFKLSKKIKESRNRPGVAQSVPGSLGFQIFTTFGTWRWWGCQAHAPAAFTTRRYSWYYFSLGSESTPDPRYGRKEIFHWKSSETTGNRSRDRPTSSAAP
jgi:hypothetical protein